MWASKSSGLGGAPPQTSTAPIAMWPFDLSLVKNDVSNDVNLSMWRCATAPPFATTLPRGPRRKLGVSLSRRGGLSRFRRVSRRCAGRLLADEGRSRGPVGRLAIGRLLFDAGERRRRFEARPIHAVDGAVVLLLPRFARQATRNDLGDPIVAHADAVEDVGGVHRPFLVGDDDELGAVGEAPDQLQEAVDVGVVEGGLDLVENVKGAGPGEEDGEDEGDRHERLLAAREKRELAGRLAGRGDLDLDPELVALLFL